MLHGTRLACLLPICQILSISLLDNFRYDTVHVRKINPHQIKVMRSLLQGKEKVWAQMHHNRTAQTNKVHNRHTQIPPLHHNHNKRKVPTDLLVAKVSMYKESAQTVIASRFTSKR